MWWRVCSAEDLVFQDHPAGEDADECHLSTGFSHWHSQPFAALHGHPPDMKISLFFFWCIACWHMGQPGPNVMPHECRSSHRRSGFELSAQRLFRTRQKMGTEGENCPALIRCKKLGQKIISAPLGKIKSSAGREWARGEMVSPGSHFIHRRVWNGFISCVDTIIHYCTLTRSSALTSFSYRPKKHGSLLIIHLWGIVPCFY